MTSHARSIITRRDLLIWSAGLLGGAATTACAALPPLLTRPTPTSNELPTIERNRTLLIAHGAVRDTPERQWNPYSSNNAHQNGSGLFYEPLCYYSAFTNSLIPWLAQEFTFSPDYGALILKLRSGVSWSGGHPFSADDVVFTLNNVAALNYEGLRRAAVRSVLDSAAAIDANTVRLKFKVPAPRFIFELAYAYDTGLYMVPKHVFEGVSDWASFGHYDPAHEWPLTTGPWRLAQTTAERTVIDRRQSWWAAAAGLAGLPAVQRLIYVPFLNDPAVLAGLRTDQLDTTDGLSPTAIRVVVESNLRVQSNTGRESPYGNIDAWPISLYLNAEQQPVDNKDVRWALSLLLDRRQLITDAFAGAAEPAPLTSPSVVAYPGLKPFKDEIEPLLASYNTLEFDPDKSARLLAGRGYARNGDGWWSRDNAPLHLEVGVIALFRELGHAVVDQLRSRGIDAVYTAPSDMEDRFYGGKYTAMLFGHPGSVSPDPYATMRLYQSTAAGQQRATWSRWHNATYDSIVDEMAGTAPGDEATLKDQYRRAMQIWLTELPDIPLVEWYHRIPMNTAYWTGWPTRDDAYVNPAFWHLTFPLVLNRLRSAQ